MNVPMTRFEICRFLVRLRPGAVGPVSAPPEGCSARPACRTGRSPRPHARWRGGRPWSPFLRPMAAPLLLCCLLPCLAIAGEVNPARWRWSNPSPHGNNILDMVVTPTVAAQVGDAGTIYVQREDERWAPAVTGVTNYLRGVALMGERFIAVGENGCILWSDDGAVFQPAQVSPATSDWFEGVAASAQRAVAVGDNGFIYTTTNGTSWTKANSGTTEWLRSVAFGAAGFVAVGENGTVLRAGSNGSSWTRTTLATAHLNRVRYLGVGASAQFYIVGTGGGVWSSSSSSGPWTSLASGTTNTLYDVALNDAGLLVVGDQEVRFRAVGTTTWTNQITDLPTNAPPAWVYLTAYGVTNYWLAAGRTGLMISGSRTNGAALYTWQPVTDSSHAWLWDLTVQRGIYVAAGDLATIQTSLDGILWAREVVPLPHTNTVLLGVGGTSNLLLAAGNAGNLLISRAGLTNLTVTNYVGTNMVVTNSTFDTLGLIWTNLPPFTTNSLQGVASDGSRFVVCGDRGQIFTSVDGSNFTARATSTTNFLSGVVSGPSGWVAVGNRGTLLRADPDAVSWSPVSLGTTNWLYRVRYLEGYYVVVGQNGSIYTSPDTLHWTPRASGTTRWLNDAAWLDGKWFVVGTQGLLLSSTNLANWQALPVPTAKSLYAAAAVNGQLLLAGIEGVIVRNQVVPATSPVDFLGYHRSVATNNIGQTNTIYTATELFLFGGSPDQFFQFQSTTNLAGPWVTNATFELFDPSGTIYLLRTRDLTNTPPREFYRTRLAP